MPESTKDASLEGTTNIKGTVKVARGTRVSGLDKSHVGLDKVDNTSDYYKPVSYYTELHVKAKIADLIGGAPEALDTLKEIATAIGSNPVPTDLGNLITAKANILSPTFTGIPKADTAETGTNTTQLATTAFVKSQDYATNTGLGLKANTASPVLTGVPTAPTAAANTNSTQLATTEFVASGLALKAPLVSPAFTGTVIAPTVLSSDNSTNVATTAHVKNQGYATLASPALTGTPTAPTAASNTNTTQLATTEFVKTAITNLTGAAPGALDTLAEIATALANDENVAGALATTVGLKAPLASPAFTGQPTGVFGYSPAKNVLALGSANDVPGTMIYDEDGDVFYFCVKRAGGKGVWKKLVPLAV